MYRAIYFFNYLLTLERLSEPLYQQGCRVQPRLVICHELHALIAGVKIKKRFGCPLIYDSHEFWPEYDLDASRAQQLHTAWLERRLVQDADVVVAVSEPIAEYARSVGAKTVLTIPNAAPLNNDVLPSYLREPSLPLRFLFQGNIGPGRGIEPLLEAWRSLRGESVQLILRGVDNDYYASLRKQFKALMDRGSLVIAPPVAEDQLVQAASASDVGIIPYPGPSRNHIYACPNKLSQYMQAGLAILACEDLQVVSGIMQAQYCGVAYNPRDPKSILEAVNAFVSQPDKLQEMKRNSYNFARSQLNWSAVSGPYSEAIQKLADVSRVMQA